MLDQVFFYMFKEEYATWGENGFANADPQMIPLIAELNKAPAIVTIDSCAGHNDGKTRHHATYITLISQNFAGEMALWGLFGKLNDVIESLPSFNPASGFKGQPSLRLKSRLVSPNRQPGNARRVMTFTFSMKFRKEQIELKQEFFDLFMEAIKTLSVPGHRAVAAVNKKD